MKKLLFIGIAIITFTILSCSDEDENGCYCDFYTPVYNESTGGFDYQFEERKSGTCDQYNTEDYFTESNCD